MDFCILGPLEVLDEGRHVPLVGSKQRALLGLLLVNANETLSTDRLIDELWGEHPPATAAKTVQVHISRLRKALAAGAGNDSEGLVVTREHGYQLEIDPERLDCSGSGGCSPRAGASWRRIEFGPSPGREGSAD
jgi:DNA-binding SARP family transcriptional activator